MKKSILAAAALSFVFFVSDAAFAFEKNEPAAIYCPDPSTTSTGGELQFASSQVTSSAENLLWQGSNQMLAHHGIPAASPWYKYYQTPYVAVTVHAKPAGDSATVLTCQYVVAYGSGDQDYQDNAGYVKTTVPGVYNTQAEECGFDAGFVKGCAFEKVS